MYKRQPLTAADGEIYAVAQGAIIAGGAVAEGQGAKITKGVPTAGIIPDGARVEREVDFDLSSLKTIRLALREADFTEGSAYLLFVMIWDRLCSQSH